MTTHFHKLFTKLLFLGLLALTAKSAQAISISAQTLSNFTIPFETAGTSVTTVQFTLDAPAEVTVEIKDLSTNAIVATLDQSFATAGAKTILWNGLYLLGQDLGRSAHYFEFTIAASSGSAVDVKTISTPLQITSVDIHNVVVTPSFDATHSPTFPYSISYLLAKDAEVTMKVVNSSGSFVRTLLNHKLQLSEAVSTNTITWNGLGDDGKAVPLGFYTVNIDAFDPSNSDNAITRSRTFAVASLAGASSDPQTLFEQNVFVYPNPVRDGQGIFQFAAVRDNATISIKIYTLTGDLVRDERFSNLTAGNISSFVWDTTNKSGRKVGRGLYFYVVREEDSQGTLQVTKKLAVLQ